MMRRESAMRGRMAALVAAGALAFGAASAEPERERPYQPTWERGLTPEGAEKRASGAAADSSPIGRFDLDSAMFAHTRGDFADLRMFDGGRPIGVHVRPVDGFERHCSEQPVPMKRVTLKVLGDSAFEAVYFVENPARLPDRIVVAVEDKDFEISLTMWTAPGASEAAAAGSLAARPAGAWAPLLRDVPLFDYSRFVDLRREDARWPAVRNRVVRIRVNGLTQTQRSLVSTLSGQVGKPGGESYQVEKKILRVDAVSFSGTVCESRRGGSLSDTAVWSGPGFSRPILEPKAKRSWYVFSAGRMPLKSLTFRSATRNFMRSVVLAGLSDSLAAPGDTAAKPWNWPTVAETRLHRIDWAGQMDSSLRIAFFPPRRYATLALGVLDNDDSPLALEGVTAETERMEGLFPAQGGPGYLLRYGDAEAAALHFDFESLLERRAGSIASTAADPAASGPVPAFSAWVAGPPRALAPPPGEPPPRFPWLTGELLLTLGLSAAIAVLMVLVFLVARKAGAAGGGPTGGGPTGGA